MNKTASSRAFRGLLPLFAIFVLLSSVWAAEKTAGVADKTNSKNKILVEMPGWVFTEKDLQARIDGLPQSQRSQFQTDEQKKIMLLNLINNHLLALEARQAGIDRNERVKSGLDDIVDFYLANAYIGERLSNSNISDQDIKGYYDVNHVSFRKPAEVFVKHILIRVDLNAPLKDVQAALEKINKIKAELDAGADFAALAGKYSEDSKSSQKGGEIGFVKKDELHPDVARATFDLPVGKYSQPVRSVFGYHIILVTEKKDERQMTLPEATPQIRELLFKEKQKEAVNREITRLKKKYNIKGI